jgi:hypothetical protein
MNTPTMSTTENTPTPTQNPECYVVYFGRYFDAYPAKIIRETASTITAYVAHPNGTGYERTFNKEKRYRGEYKDPRQLCELGIGSGIRNSLDERGSSYGRTKLTFDIERVHERIAEEKVQRAVNERVKAVYAKMDAFKAGYRGNAYGDYLNDEQFLAKLDAIDAALSL